MSVKINFTILVAPLDWGLGHATRCVPIIQHLLLSGCKVIIAAEGKQEKLLKTEFPAVEFVHLPGYCINYSNSKRFFLIKILWQLPKVIKAIKNEHKWLQKFVTESKIDAIISDNRYGFYHRQIPCVFITHQLTIKSPFAQLRLSRFNYSHINRFAACWVPDEKGRNNIAGDLSHPKRFPEVPVKYLGGISRLNFRESIHLKYKMLIIISGPEPQRTLLEKHLLKELTDFNQKVLFIRGLPGDESLLKSTEFIEIKNHLPAGEMELAFQQCEYIISRSGYTTVMDICKLQKKSILIPTPGQTEQEYLAKHLEKQGWCISAEQRNFSLIENLSKAENFDYKLPALNMETYKEVVDELIKSLQKVV